MTERIYTNEVLPRRICQTAVSEGRAADLLNCLMDGGTAMVDRDGKLVLVSGDIIKSMARGLP